MVSSSFWINSLTVSSLFSLVNFSIKSFMSKWSWNFSLMISKAASLYLSCLICDLAHSNLTSGVMLSFKALQNSLKMSDLKDSIIFLPSSTWWFFTSNSFNKLYSNVLTIDEFIKIKKMRLNQ